MNRALDLFCVFPFQTTCHSQEFVSLFNVCAWENPWIWWIQLTQLILFSREWHVAWNGKHCDATEKVSLVYFCSLFYTVPCPVGTRRDLNPYCKKRRDHDLEKRKQVYQLGPTYLNLFPSINVTIQQLKAIYKNDPVNAEWLTIYETISRRNLVILYSFLKQTNLSEVTAVEDYKNVLKFFIESQYSPRLMPKVLISSVMPLLYKSDSNS